MMGNRIEHWIEGLHDEALCGFVDSYSIDTPSALETVVVVRYGLNYT
jgi:hypothetical protein